MIFEHTSVMSDEVYDNLNLSPGKIVVDCTLGGSGHALQIIKAIQRGGTLIGIDQDIDAIKNAEKVLKPFAGNFVLFHDNFSALPSILESLNVKGVDGILLDLGLSLHQLRNGKRGFSFQRDEPLDMRMDTRSGRTAADIVNAFSERELADIFFRYGEERMSRRIAKHIVTARQIKPLETSKELACIVKKAVPAKIAHAMRIHPATRVFQALRIAVNRELEKLETFMDTVPDILNRHGRLCVISFHSLEDRIVKQKIRSFENGCTCPRDFPECICGFKQSLKSISKKPIRPTDKEIMSNPMARSAVLRVAERL